MRMSSFDSKPRQRIRWINVRDVDIERLAGPPSEPTTLTQAALTAAALFGEGRLWRRREWAGLAYTEQSNKEKGLVRMSVKKRR